jgi:hypothetical protein
MFVEIASSIAMGSVVGYSYLKQNGSPTNDADKIKRIFANARLNINEDGKQKTLRLFRKTPIEGGTEYVFQFQYGMSVKKIKENKHMIEDGLNVRNSIVSMKDILNLSWDQTIIKQIRELRKGKKVARKEIDIDMDGMLRIKVYEEPLTDEFDWSDDLFRKDWRVVIGQSRSAVIYHDFEKQPNLLVAGTPGFGKSQYLKALITSTILAQPKHAKFTLIDLKEGVSFARFRDCRQVNQVACNAEQSLDALKAVQNDMNATYERLVANGHEDVKEAGIKARHFVVIDEAADLTDDKDAMAVIKDIARRGRAAGVRLVYSSQYTSMEAIPSQVKRNIPTRLSFALDSNTASRTVLDVGGAEDLPEIPGRAIYKRLRSEVVQTPYIRNDEIKRKIAPHITFKPRKECSTDANVSETGTAHGSNTVEYSTTGLS